MRKELDPLQEDAQSYKEKFEDLTRMIEPFREQLESFEMERTALLADKKEAQGQMEKLADQYAELLGHQNHKQKIHHLVRLKKENLQLREEVSQQTMAINKYKRQLEKLKQNKENAPRTGLGASLLKTPLGNKKAVPSTPMSSYRRQTIASPLTNRNSAN